MFIIEPTQGDDLRKVLFLDRDGTLIHDSAYLHEPDKVQWLEGVLSTLKILQIRGWEFVVVTNQSGVARGMYSEEDIDLVHARMQESLDSFGVRILEWKYCPHHPDITGPCDCRKPLPGMISSVIQANDLNPDKCVMLGDKISDVQAGQSAHLNSYRLDTRLSKDNLQEGVFTSFAAFGSYLLKNHSYPRTTDS